MSGTKHDGILWPHVKLQLSQVALQYIVFRNLGRIIFFKAILQIKINETLAFDQSVSYEVKTNFRNTETILLSKAKYSYINCLLSCVNSVNPATGCINSLSTK